MREKKDERVSTLVNELSRDYCYPFEGSTSWCSQLHLQSYRSLELIESSA